MQKKPIVFFLLFLFATGCATAGKPMSQWEADVTLGGYKVFEVVPINNDTGKIFEFDVSGTITEHLKARLKEKGFAIAEEQSVEENVIIIKSSLISYTPGSAFSRWLFPGAGKTECTVRSTLIDKKTGKILGEIIANKVISEGGLYSIGADKAILKSVASDIADEIDKKVKNK